MLGGRKLLWLFLVPQMGDWGWCCLQPGPQKPITSSRGVIVVGGNEWTNLEFFFLKPHCQLGILGK